MSTEEAMTAVRDALARIAPEVELSDADPDAAFRSELDLDSLDFLSLVQALHNSTGVDILEADYGTVSTLNGLAAYLVAAHS